ncbi:SLAP domain-containing protein [Virgibacillus sp. DJP39]|uniref:SLAP domain-containing protein n=1 Tax=Virgibacillus sp. DJP39 TaxID=3409790 RepID=UPI003BB52C2D
MQKLIFESKWDKTIADQDRDNIKQVFKESVLAPNVDIQFTSLWQAKNHRGDLLVAVLIHNSSAQNFSFDNQMLTYTVEDSIFSEHTFSLPVTVEKQTSMPWTFIFPAGRFNDSEKFHDGNLHLTLNY